MKAFSQQKHGDNGQKNSLIGTVYIQYIKSIYTVNSLCNRNHLICFSGVNGY